MTPSEHVRTALAAIALFSLPVSAQSSQFFAGPGSPDSYSTSVSPVTSEALETAPSSRVKLVPPTRHVEPETYVSTRPFSAVALRAGLGSGGIAVELATPLNLRMNLRGGASMFSTSLNPNIGNVDVLAQVHLASGFGAVDIHPFAGSFRISPGVTFFNDVNAAGTGTLQAGTSFSLGNATYFSSPDDPLIGSAQVNLGKRIAPRLTVGWGNLIPHRRGQHFSMPFEIGAHYVGAPSIRIWVTGSACDNQNQCGPVSAGDTFQQDLLAETAKLKSTLSPYAIIPIISTGLSYKF